MIDIESAKESISPKLIFDWIKYQIEFKRNNPTYFDPDGLVVFFGPQGSGKTLSAVNYVANVLKKYPHTKLVTNIMIKEYPVVTFEQFKQKQDLIVKKAELTVLDHATLFNNYLLFNRVFPFNNADDFGKYHNDIEGVIYLIDEIQLYFSSLESKNVNPDVLNTISQQRKQRIHVVCTSQVFGRLAKYIREQFSVVIQCKKFLRCIQRNQLVDRDSIDDSVDDQHISGKVLKTFWSIHNPKHYGRYDTYYTIDKNKFVANEKKISIYEKERGVANNG